MNASAARLLAGCRNAVSSPAAPMALNVALVVAIAWTAATLTWRLLPGPASVPDRSIPAAGPAAAGEPERTDVAALHLFGQAPAGDTTASRPVPTEAPETRLNLKLTGVFAAGGGDGIAIIVAGNAEQAVYGVGDRVAGAARIDGIYADRVLLERNGALETLRLSEDGVATERAGAARGSGDRDIQRIAQRARELRQRLTENPLELARMVRFQPYMRDGELVGYRIQPRTADAELLAELGLRPTDVVTRVNGVALNDPVQAQQALQRVQTAQTISVTWLRDGEQHRMTIPVGPVR
ncbi:MAG: type II secretion system protein GspC [Halofilum sp. (in: g-proteobacteria)]|nr:type II secretion system protein GspC [Halofilum sp. (in: g-proteobacteria)]